MLALLDGKPAGCIAYRKLDDATCEMKRMYVSPAARGHEIGKLLAEKLFLAAQKAGYGRMVLDTHPWMTHAQALYAKLGFTETKRYN